MSVLIYFFATIGVLDVLWVLLRAICLKCNRSFPFFRRMPPMPDLPPPRPDHESLAAIVIGMVTKQRYENPTEEELAEALLLIHKAEAVVLSPSARQAAGLPG